MRKLFVNNRGNVSEQWADYNFMIYKSCAHNCPLCNARSFLKKSGNELARLDLDGFCLTQLERELKNRTHEELNQDVMLSLAGDVYQPIERKLGLTRKTLSLLVKYNQRFSILTKGKIADRDFDILKNYSKCRFGVSLISLEKIKDIEPWCASPQERIELIRKAKANNIETFVSIAPILFEYRHNIVPLIHEINSSVDSWILNWYIPTAPRKVRSKRYYDWLKTINNVKEEFEKTNATYKLSWSIQGLYNKILSESKKHIMLWNHVLDYYNKYDTLRYDFYKPAVKLGLRKMGYNKTLIDSIKNIPEDIPFMSQKNKDNFFNTKNEFLYQRDTLQHIRDNN